jgi:hypothetical protein
VFHTASPVTDDPVCTTRLPLVVHCVVMHIWRVAADNCRL